MKLEKHNWNHQTYEIQPTLGDLVDAANGHEDRIAALEAKFTNDDSGAVRALMDADNAIQKVIAHFRRTDAENRK